MVSTWLSPHEHLSESITSTSFPRSLSPSQRGHLSPRTPTTVRESSISERHKLVQTPCNSGSLLAVAPLVPPQETSGLVHSPSEVYPSHSADHQFLVGHAVTLVQQQKKLIAEEEVQEERCFQQIKELSESDKWRSISNQAVQQLQSQLSRADAAVADAAYLGKGLALAADKLHVRLARAGQSEKDLRSCLSVVLNETRAASSRRASLEEGSTQILNELKRAGLHRKALVAQLLQAEGANQVRISAGDRHVAVQRQRAHGAADEAAAALADAWSVASELRQQREALLWVTMNL